MSKRRYIQNLRSQTIINANGGKKPKLPEANDIKEGEIAINFATGYETMAIKNADGKIVKFDNKVDENYEPTHYNDRFDDLVDNTVVTNNNVDNLNTHIAGGDNIGFAFKKTEGTINKLVEEIYDNEEITAKSIGTLGIATGVINDKGIIGYKKEKDTNYIAGANSIHEATMMLDDEVSTINRKAKNIATATGVINDKGIIGYKKEKDTNYIAGANSIHEATVKLDYELGKQSVTDLEIVKAIGLTESKTGYTYKVNENSNYIKQVNSVDEATIALDSQVKADHDLIEGVYNIFSDYDKKFDEINKVISKFPSIEYVDLGLPSGTLWLTCNLGATTPTGIGHYYMWGSLSPNDKTDCNWSNTPFNGGQAERNDTLFNAATAGSKNIVLYQNRLNEAFDVIYHRTHGIAKLPTKEQLLELYTNTTTRWVENYQKTNVNGFTFTSKTNNNVLFIPAGGYRDSTNTLEVNKVMFIMSSAINTNSHNVEVLKGYMDTTNHKVHFPDNTLAVRNRAIPLRGVIV